jgi:hypothetical protein
MHEYKQFLGKKYSSSELEKFGCWKSDLGNYVLENSSSDLIFGEVEGMWTLTKECIDVHKPTGETKLTKTIEREINEQNYFVQKSENERRDMERKLNLRPGSLIFNNSNTN